MGLGLSSSKKNLDFGRYDWAATHACQTNTHEWNGGYLELDPKNTGYNFSKSLELAANGNLQALGSQDSGVSIQDLLTTAGSDFCDKISFSMWIKPTWSHSGSTSSGTWSNGTTSLPLFQMNTSNPLGGDLAVFAYLNYRSGSSFRNRITIITDSGTDRAGVQRAMHDVNSITGTGSSGTSVNSLWDEANPGNANTEGYVHLAFVRDEGTQGNAWDVYWNAQDLNMNIDVGTGDDEPQFTDDTAEFLGIGTYRAKTSNYESGTKPYNVGLTSMRIRDFAIFKGVMNLKDVQLMYNSGNFIDVRTLPGGFSQADLNAGPVLYYPLNHNLADYARNSADLSGNVSFVAL